MSNLNRHPVRRAAAGVLAGALALSGAAVAAGVSPANAVPSFNFERLEGADRYATAAAIAREAFTTANDVVLASGAPRNFPDALTGNYLAGEVQGPILLTTPGSLPRATRDAMTALQTKKVWIVGGTSAVSASVEAELVTMGMTVERLGGIDRYATAEIVAKRVGADATNIGTLNGARTAILGNGQNFPDILAAGPLSYSQQFPLAITMPNALTADTRDVLRDLGISRVIIVGGTSAVSAEVEAEVRAMAGITSVTRLAGNDRYGTAVSIANFAYETLNYDNTHVGLARSDDFADALAGGPLAGKERAPIVITLPTTLVEPTRAFLAAHANTLATGHVFGGQAAISTSVENAAEAAAGATTQTTNQTFTITPAETVVNTVSTGELDNTGRRNYTVANPASGKVHSIVLLDAANVSVAANGTVTISSATSVAANSGVSLEIVEGAFVQAAATGAGTTYFEVTPTGGELTFSIDSVRNDANVVPVVFFDADGDDMLDLNADGTPVAAELFGVGGATMYVPAEAEDNTTTTAASITVTRMDKDANYVVTADALYNYDSNDTFRLNGVLIDQARFEGLLSAGDVLDVVYRRDAANVSTFNVTTDDVAAASAVRTTVSEVAADQFNVTVNWTGSTQSDVTYTVSRGGTVVATGVSGTSFVDTDVPDGTYTYTVTATAATSGRSSTAASSDSVVVPPVKPTDPEPTVMANGAAVDVNAGAATATAGDVWTLMVSEAVTISSSAAIQVNGSVIVENGVNGTFTKNAAGDMVTITLNTDLPGAPSYPLTITTVTGIADSAGKALTFSADNSLEDDGPEIARETASSGDTTFTVTFNEAVIKASAENVNNYAYSSGAGAAAAAPTSATLGADGRTVTLVVPTAVAAGATVSPAGVVDTDGQASAQGAVALEAAGTDTTPPRFTSAAAAAGTRIMTLGYSEPLDCTTPEAADYSVTFAATAGGTASTIPTANYTASCDAATGTVTLTFASTTTAFASGNNGTVTKLAEGVVTDVAGVEQPDLDAVNYTVQ